MPGGSGGRPFGDKCFSSQGVSEIIVRHGTYIDSIYVKFKDGTRSGPYGGGGGKESIFRVDPDDQISCVEVWAGKVVDGLRFTTKNKKVSDHFGGKGGNYFKLAPNKGDVVLGFEGKSGKLVDNLNALYGKVDFEVTTKPKLLCIFQGLGDVNADFTQEIEVKKGYERTTDVSSELHTKVAASAETSGSAFGQNYKASLSAEVATDLVRSTHISNQKVETQKIKVQVRGDKPCYIYQMAFDVTCGDEFFQVWGGGWTMSPKPLTPKEQQPLT